MWYSLSSVLLRSRLSTCLIRNLWGCQKQDPRGAGVRTRSIGCLHLCRMCTSCFNLRANNQMRLGLKTAPRLNHYASNLYSLLEKKKIINLTILHYKRNWFKFCLVASVDISPASFVTSCVCVYFFNVKTYLYMKVKMSTKTSVICRASLCLKDSTVWGVYRSLSLS